MKIALCTLVLLVVVLTFCIDDSDALRWRRIVRKGGKWLCKKACKKTACRYGYYACAACKNRCRGKRDIHSEDEGLALADLAQYDQNDDGHISLAELAGAMDEDQHVKLADPDDDEKLADME